MFAAYYEIAAVYHKHLPRTPSQLRWLVDPLIPAAAIPENQHAVFAIKADLRQDDELHRIVDMTLARYGRIDFLVNAAAYSQWAPMLDGDRLCASFHHQLQLNAYVPLRLSGLVAEKFWKTRDQENRLYNRSVVNVSSTGYRDQGQSVYSASKAALNYLTLHMAEEFAVMGVRADGIRRLSEGTTTGKIMVLNVDGESWF